MTNSTQGRILIAHNFNISDQLIPELSRDEFAICLIEGFNGDADINCSAVNHPHWIVEVLFDANQRSPLSIGTICVQQLANQRKTQKSNNSSPLHILALGGMKTTPAMSSSATSLQPGEWGVDLVETASAEQFLKSIDWETTIASKPPENIFAFQLDL